MPLTNAFRQTLPAGKEYARLQNYRKICIFCWLALLLLFAGLSSAAGSAPASFEALKARLAADGFPKERLDTLYRLPAVKFAPKAVQLFFMHNESKLNYDQFAKPDQIQKARQYLAVHQAVFQGAQARYQVPPAIITAILLVETRLGGYTGKSRVLNTLSTLAALKSPQAREALWQQMPDDRRLDFEKYQKKARNKADWGYTELKALLNYTERENISPEAVQGSYAGALGICQFLPSNALTLAKDGNGDGHIDLFDHADAIMSVAHYLYRHGWRKGIDQAKRNHIIMRYNHSQYYARIVLKIATLLEAAQ